MKKILFILSVILLASCGTRTVKLNNGMKVPVIAESDVDYKIGDKICIYRVVGHQEWRVDYTGEMLDTTTCITAMSAYDNQKHTTCIEYKIGELVE